MRTKNIQQFRTLWRNEEGYNMSDWDENFIGSAHNGKMFGFYRMVNGIVENIKADLTPKLQNAQDEQAIYEFLQNAADSKSTECAIIYDENYFMVLNNGSPFTEKDLKALLNSFQGTKADKSKPENCGKIGRYGIGFKLAYRLMGKSDGAEELISQLAGPVLFSWKNSEDFNTLINYKTGDFANFQAGDTWLLKIILTCFPVGLNETVKDLDYNEKVLFNEGELTELVDFMNKHSKQIERLNLNQGSMFFLKFGPKKHEKLKESLLNIQSGIGYSMNTLKTLEKVILQDTVVEKYDIEFEQINVLPGTEDFLRIDPEFPNCPIEISLGFPKKFDQMSALKRSPSIYQFFPMRNERHNMAYFIHSTSFSKITDRTRLDDQGEANIESLKFISKTLKKHLTKYKSENFDRFALIYRSLLLTDKSEEYDAELINTHLYNQMLEFLRTAIPTNKKNLYLKDLVVLKETELNIDPMRLGIGKEWFLWSDSEHEKELMNEAANNAKLGLKRWGLKELLTEGNNDLIDNWLDEMHADEYKVFVLELKKIDFDKLFIEKFQFLKCFRFTDNKSKNILLSIRDLQTQDNVFLINERTALLKDVIKDLGFAVLEFDVRDFANIFQQLEKQLDYLTNDKALFLKLTLPCKHSNLSSTQKHLLFDFLTSLNGIKQDDLRDLALFSNGYGIIMPMKRLLSLTAQTEVWLEDFKINKIEFSEKLNPFLCKNEGWEVYENIIVPEWHNLVKHSSLKTPDSAAQFYEKIIDWYKAKNGLSKPADNCIVFVDNELGFVDSNKVLYFRNLTDIKNYEALAKAVHKVLNLYLPEKSVFKYFGADPLRLLPVTVSKDWRKISNDLFTNCRDASLSVEEKIALFQLLKLILSPDDLKKIELFENNKNEKTILQNMISSSLEVEFWLKPFQIKDFEDSDLITSHCSGVTDIFNNIISENWNTLVSSEKVISNFEAFYNSVEKYFNLTKSPKNINNGNLIFISDNIGFVAPTQVCYHPLMENFELYKDLRKAITSLTGFHTCQSTVLPYLSRKPFKTKESGLLAFIKNEAVVMNKEEVTALIQYMEQTNEDFFKSLTVTENENGKGFVVMKRLKSIPFYLEKSQAGLAEKIKEQFGDSYRQLPHKLYNPNLRNEGLIMGTALFNMLSRSGELSPDFLSTLITESESTEMRELVFSKINKIVLKQSMIYDKNSFEHQALQIFRSKDADYDKIREKIFFEDKEGRVYKLTEIAFEPNVTISIEREGKFVLVLADILPFFIEIQTVISDIIEKFIDYEAPAILKKRCFEVNEMPLNSIYTELKKNYKSVQNASQLAFLALYSKIEDKISLLDGFEFQNVTGQKVNLSSYSNLHVNAVSFIENEAILNQNEFSGLSTILKLNDKRPFFEFAGHRIVIEPYFDKNIFHCYPLQNSNESSYVLELFNYCFEKWKKAEDLTGSFLISLGNYEIIPDISAFVYPDNYALENEKLPDWIKNWLGNDASKIDFDDNENQLNNENEEQDVLDFDRNKINFLVKLGLNAHQSKLVKLRRYLLENKGQVASQKLMNEIYNINSRHLDNTIHWLNNKNAEFCSEDDRIFWLRKLYNTFEEFPETLPVPVISSVNELNSIFYNLKLIDPKLIRFFDNKQAQLLTEKYEISLNQLFTALTNHGLKLTNLSIKNLEILGGTIEEILDLDYLNQESREWAAAHYLKWREEVPFKVLMFQGKIPFLLNFLGKTIKILKMGNAIVNERFVYVNSIHGNVEEALFEIANRNNITELMLLQLLRYKNETDVKVSNQPVIEKIIEKVYIPEIISEEDELLDNPDNELIMNIKNSGIAGQIKMSFDINQVSEEMLENMLKLSKSNRLIVSKKESKSVE